MRVEFDPDKRLRTLQERGLDFMDAPQIFAGNHVTFPDRRRIYGEDRYITFGFLNHRMTVTVWTERNGIKRIISMRKANEREVRRIALVER